ENVDTSLVKVVPGAATPITALIVGKTGIAGTIFCDDERIRLTTAELAGPTVRSALTDSDAVLVTLEPPLPVIERVLATLAALPKRPTLLLAAADVETPHVLYRYLSTVDYLIGSTKELDSMVPEIPAQSGPHIARQLQLLGTPVVCVVEDFG